MLNYSLDYTCSWLDVNPISGDSIGEHDTITISINTTGLGIGAHHYDITIISNGGNDSFSVDVFIISDDVVVDIDQSVFDRGYRMMPGWDAAQEFTPSYEMLSHVGLYLSKFGSPTGDVTFEIRQGSPDGTPIYFDTISSEDVPSFPDYAWVTVNIGVDLIIGETYFVVLKDATGADTHNCVQWGWCDSYPSGSGGPYDGGWFHFRKEGNPTWSPIRDWDFTFRTYGFN
jgi:hypothetical protein